MLVLAPALQGFMMTDELVAPVCEAAAALNLPVYVHTGPHAHGAPSQVVLAAELFPCTRFILGHCGGTDHGWDMPAILRAHRPDNLWFELSLARPWAASGYVELAGADRLIWASGAPRNQPAFELEQLRSRLDAQAAPAILGTNAATLLNLGTP